MYEFLEKLRQEAIKHSLEQIDIQTEFHSEIDAFMHQTLRPILKLTHSSIIQVFQDFVERNKIVIRERVDLKEQDVAHLLKKNQKIRHIYAGFIMGWIPQDQVNIYFEHYSEVNKRLMNMLIQRILSAI